MVNKDVLDLFMPPRKHYVLGSAVRPSGSCRSFNIYVVCRDISVVSWGISMKLNTIIQYVSEQCKKGFQGQGETKCTFPADRSIMMCTVK